MSSRCTCCHICHTSVKTSRRSFFPCSACPSIICRQCIEGMNESWDDLGSSCDWECPRCRNCCPCKRCKNKEANGDRSSRRASVSPEKRSKKRPSRYSSESPVPKKQKLCHNESAAYPEFLVSLSKMSQKVKEPEDNPVTELQKKNAECLNYIGRTERLLEIIREEQARISSELATLLNKNSGKSQSCNLSIAV